MPTLYGLHVEEWNNCARCDLHKTRQNVVFARGDIPCQVLFVGEGPGESEDIVAEPFVGPAGKLLDQIVDESVPEMYSRAFYNLVGCIPREETGNKSGAPNDDEIQACSPRLEQFIKLCDYWQVQRDKECPSDEGFVTGRQAADYRRLRLIVCVGATARDRFDPKVRHHIKLHRPYKWWLGESSRKDCGIMDIRVVEIRHPSGILRINEAQQSLLIRKCVVTIANAIAGLRE